MNQEKKRTVRRVFFGIPIPEEKAKEFSERLIKENPQLKQQVRWTRPGNHHITLRFLGNIEEQKISPLIELTSKSTKEINSFEVTLRSITLFPVHYGQLSAINITPSLALQTLYNAINFSVNHFDFPKEKRSYLPHITLFRSNSIQPIQLEKILLDNECLLINAFILYQSILIQGGSEYKPLHTFKLKT